MLIVIISSEQLQDIIIEYACPHCTLKQLTLATNPGNRCKGEKREKE
jgi:hypothetical protein